MDPTNKRKAKEGVVDLNNKEHTYSFLINNNIVELSNENVFKLEFESEVEAEKFYSMHARLVGFSIRKDNLKRNKNNEVVCRRWVCSKEGFRLEKSEEKLDGKREPKAITRVGCKAVLRIKFQKMSCKWVVVEFLGDHNHELVNPCDVQFLRSHRCLAEADMAQVQAMRGVGMKTSQIMDLMVNQAGGYENVGFIAKDMYNYVDAERRSKLLDGDAEGALAYLSAKCEMDLSFYYKYTIDDEDRLGNLFWADSMSQLDYASFGDILAFDSTYRKNAYNKPLVILVGVNNHYQTTVFGLALLVNETTETYMWVLETFLAVMQNKKPISVVTDGDKAMRTAITKVLPDARHRLCVWHLERNAQSNLNNVEVTREFTACMVDYVTPVEFEEMWKTMVDKHRLHDNQWVVEMYAKRDIWAQAYLRGHFFAMCRSTQRSESMNSFLNRFIQNRTKLYELFQQVDRALSRIRHNEAKADFDSNHTKPVLCTVLDVIEENAATIFTKELFRLVQKELKLEGKLTVLNRVDHEAYRTYTICKYGHPESSWEVVYHRVDHSMKCTCLMFESLGIPCRHFFSVMKSEHLKEIPSTCIMKRWTKCAKSNIPLNEVNQISSDVMSMARFSALCCSSNGMCYLGSKSSEAFEELRREIARLTCRMEELCNSSSQATQVNEEGGHSREVKRKKVHDPVIVRAKGDHIGTGNNKEHGRKCGKCKLVGHNRRRCPTDNIQISSNVESNSQNEQHDMDTSKDEPFIP